MACSKTLRIGSLLSATIATLFLGCRASPSGVGHSVPTGVKPTDPISPGAGNAHEEPWESTPTSEGSIIDWGDEPRLTIGSRDTDREHIKYTISATLAVEEWENSERSKGRWERWFLTCSNYVPGTRQGPGSKPEFAEWRGDWCILERLVFVSAGGTFVSSFHYMTDDRTLTITQVDWPNGVLDLAIVNAMLLTTNIELRFAFDGSLMYLRSFKGIAVSKDPLTTYEYHIPEYTYVLNIPLQMQGWRSAGQKAWHAMFDTLSLQDQEAWRKFAPSRRDEFWRLETESQFTEAVKAAVPDYEAIKSGKRKPTAHEAKLIEKVALESYRAAAREWLSKSSVSSQGQVAILAHLATTFR